MQTSTPNQKPIGFVRVSVSKEPPLEGRITQAMTKQLSIIFDPSKHKYVHVNEPQKMLGSALYQIFEQIV